MFDPHEESHRINAQAMAARRKARIKHGLASEPEKYACAVSPGTDYMTIQREGAPGHPLTDIIVAAHSHGTSLGIFLTPTEARRAAMSLIRQADAVDGMETDFQMIAHAPEVIPEEDL